MGLILDIRRLRITSSSRSAVTRLILRCLRITTTAATPPIITAKLDQFSKIYQGLHAPPKAPPMILYKVPEPLELVELSDDPVVVAIGLITVIESPFRI